MTTQDAAKIAIDGRCIAILPDGTMGNTLGRFTEDILDGFKELGVSDHFVIMAMQDRYDAIKSYFPDYDVVPYQDLRLKAVHDLTHGKRSGTNLFGVGRHFQKAGAQMAWYPAAMPSRVNAIPSVCTVHDMFWDNARQHSTGGYMMRHAAQLVAISKYTANMMRECFPSETQGKTIQIIPNAVRDTFQQTQKNEGLSRPYILDVNSASERKNPMTLLKAFARIADSENFDLVYVFGGDESQNPVYLEMERYCAEENLTNRVHFLSRVSFEERNWLYKNAVMLVDPSVSEGFGRTPIEAQMCEIPVITTRETTLPEVTLGLAKYVNDPYDPVELSTAIVSVIHRPPEQGWLRSVSKKIRETYSPQTVAAMYLKLFNLEG